MQETKLDQAIRYSIHCTPFYRLLKASLSKKFRCLANDDYTIELVGKAHILGEVQLHSKDRVRSIYSFSASVEMVCRFINFSNEFYEFRPNWQIVARYQGYIGGDYRVPFFECLTFNKPSFSLPLSKTEIQWMEEFNLKITGRP